MSGDQAQPLTQGYRVWVDDNYHYMEEDERYKLGEYATYEEALKAARMVVASFFKMNMIGRPAAELMKEYKSFGEDSWIETFGGAPEVSPRFSAWTYAEEMSEKVSRGVFSGEK